MTAYTPILNIPQVATNQNNKETTINTGLAILEAAFNDSLGVDLSAADAVLTLDDFTKNFAFKLTGNTVARKLDTPAPSGGYTGKRVFGVINTGSADVTVRPGGEDAGAATVTAGQASLLLCDGTAIATLSSGAAPVSGAAFNTLTDVPSSYDTEGLKGVRVKASEDGLEFFTIPATQRAHYAGAPAASEPRSILITESWKLPTDLGESQFHIGVLPTADTTFTLNQITGGTTTEIGSIKFAATTGDLTVTFAADVTFGAGDVLQIVAPASADATAADIAFAFKGTLQ